VYFGTILIKLVTNVSYSFLKYSSTSIYEAIENSSQIYVLKTAKVSN
jgi:hypothetical protein